MATTIFAPDEIILNLSAKPRSVPPKVRRKVTDKLHALTSGYLDDIPLAEIFAALDDHGLIPLQEDGTRWAGMLLGNAEAGTERANDQRASIALAYAPAGHPELPVLAPYWLHLTWCTVGSRYEVVAYLN